MKLISIIVFLLFCGCASGPHIIGGAVGAVATVVGGPAAGDIAQAATTTLIQTVSPDETELPE